MRRATTLNAVFFAAFVLVVATVALVRAWGFRPDGSEDVLRGKLAHSFESHYDKVFPVRTFGVALWAALDFVCFHEGRPGVVLGKDGWLYTDEEFNVGNGAARELDRNLALVGWVHRELAKRGIALVVAVVPAKARVYAEHLDRREPPQIHRGLYADIESTLSADGIANAKLLAPLEDGKSREPTFLRTDTHWTPYGASLAANAIAESAAKIDVGANASYRTVSDGERTHRGDLLNFLPFDPYFAFLLPPPDTVETVRTESNGDAGGGGLLGDASNAPVALVGTSYSAESQWNFAGALKQALHADVMNYAKDGEGPFAPMLRYLESDDLGAAPPKLVVWEMPERYLLAHQSLDAFHVPAEAFVPNAGTEVASTANTGEPP
jgi:alginate O-acetyltransferase complex protein AlgJ